MQSGTQALIKMAILYDRPLKKAETAYFTTCCLPVFGSTKQFRVHVFMSSKEFVVLGYI